MRSHKRRTTCKSCLYYTWHSRRVYITVICFTWWREGSEPPANLIDVTDEHLATLCAVFKINFPLYHPSQISCEVFLMSSHFTFESWARFNSAFFLETNVSTINLQYFITLCNQRRDLIFLSNPFTNSIKCFQSHSYENSI